MLTTFLAAFFAFMVGLALCFAGYRFFLVMLPIFGFFAGFWLGGEIAALMFGGGFLATTTGFVMGFLIGIMTGLLSYLFYGIGVAIVSFGFGAALVGGFMGLFGVDGGIILFGIEMVAGFVMVIVSFVVNLQKYVIIFITAVSGANALVLAPMLLFGQVSTEQVALAGNSIRPLLAGSWFWGLIWLAVAVAGFVVQLRVNRSYVYNQETYVVDWG